MPIIKCRNHIEVYREKARSDSLHEMSGRSNRPDLTRFVSDQIVKQLNVTSDDHVIDIGCGDGTLLANIADRVASATGILPTDEEVMRLGRAPVLQHGHLSIRQGTAQRLPCDDDSADKLVCNGVLLLLTDAEVDQALGELHRVGRPGALVYIGEIPAADEFADRPYGDSILRWLLWSLRERGFTTFTAYSRQVIRALLSSQPLVIAPKRHFHTTPEIFIERAGRFGLRCLAHHPHREIDEDGKVKRSATRWDYLFTVDRHG